MKKWFGIALVLVLLIICILPTKAEAATIERSGKCGMNVTYTLDSDGVLTISGTGSTWDYDCDDDDCAPWLDREWEDEILKIVIESGVTDIGDELFYGCQDMVSVTIPSTVTTIGESAFFNCNSMTGITIASGLKTIYKSAFSRCSALTSILIPGTVTTIGAYAFEHSGLTSFTVGANVTSIDPTAFNYCSSLTKFAVNSSNTSFSVDTKGALFNKSKTTLIMAPRGISGSYTVPSTVTSIGDKAFYTCMSLTGISISSKVTSIGSYAFYQCTKLTEVTIPASVKTIGDWAFGACGGLSKVTMNGVTTIGASAFYQCYNMSSVVLNSGVTTIGNQAFYKCTNLANITFPSTVTSLGTNVIGGTAYYKNLPDGIIYLGSVLYGVKGTCPTTVSVRAGTISIADNAFSLKDITSVTLPSGLKTIGYRAFYYTQLTSITIPSTVTQIGAEAFYLCSKLSSVSMPSKLTTISDKTFESCAALTRITLPSSLQSIGYQAFKGAGLTSITIPASVTTIGEDAFRSANLAAIYMGTGVTSVGNAAFYTTKTTPSVYISDLAAWCRIDFGNASANPMSCGGPVYINYAKASTITIPSTVTEIKPYAFASCTTDITSVVIHSNIRSIGRNAFYYCKGLTSIAIPGSVADIGAYAFYYCSGLKSITISNGVTSIGDNAFDGCSAVTAVTIPGSVTSIGGYAFGGCSALTNILIPEGVKTIGNYAFRSCGKLTHIVLPKTLTSVGSYAFNSCSKLSQVCYTGTETQRSAVTVSSGNTYLTNAAWVYNAVDPVIEPHETCTEVQHICSYCKRAVWTEAKQTPTHSWTEATCTTAKTCTVCGATEGEAPGHSGEMWFEIIAPTCTAEGMKARICTVCNETETQTVAALGHSYSAVVTAPTCTGQGYTTNTCSVCGDATVTDYVAATGHSLESVVTAPTCTEQGYTTNTCSVCSETTITDYVAATGHSFGVWTQTKAPGCEEVGEEARACACGETETQTVAALGHKYSSIVTAPTCTEQGYTTNTCSVCGAVTVTDHVDATGHSFGAWEQTTAPGCVTEGEEKRNCTCGEIETQIVPAKGHSWSAWIQTAAPTCTADGSRLRFCNCGTRETEAIAKLSHSFENEVCTRCGESEYFRMSLTEDTTVTLELERDVYIQLNGFDLTGTITTNGFKVYGMDETTAGYTCENIGYFTCVDEKGDLVVPERYYQVDSENWYLTVGSDEGYSFHAVRLAVTHMTLRPDVVGVGYKAVLSGDEMVFSQLDAAKAFRFCLQLDGYDPVYRHLERGELVSGNEISFRLINYDIENYGETDLFASLAITLQDGTVLGTPKATMTMRSLFEYVNDNTAQYTQTQLADIKTMIETYAIIKKWDVSNLI